MRSAGFLIHVAGRTAVAAVAAALVLTGCSSEPIEPEPPEQKQSTVSEEAGKSPSPTPTPTPTPKSTGAPKTEAAVEAAAKSYIDAWSRVINANTTDDSPLRALGTDKCACGLGEKIKESVENGAMSEGFGYEVRRNEATLDPDKKSARAVVDAYAREFMYIKSSGEKPVSQGGILYRWTFSYLYRDGEWKVDARKAEPQQ